ncbi:hypothetical protein JOD14_000767 [Enterococcus lemanii]|nr:hypothetical protein [Enterococcus lemanii]
MVICKGRNPVEFRQTQAPTSNGYVKWWVVDLKQIVRVAQVTEWSERDPKAFQNGFPLKFKKILICNPSFDAPSPDLLIDTRHSFFF